MRVNQRVVAWVCACVRAGLRARVCVRAGVGGCLRVLGACGCQVLRVLGAFGRPVLVLDPIFCSTPAGIRERLVSQFSLDATEPAVALGYTFDIVLRGPLDTPMEHGR